MGLIRYSCGHISGPGEPIPTKFGLWMFFIMLRRDMISKTMKCKICFLMTSHFGTLLVSLYYICSDLIVQPMRLNHLNCSVVSTLVLELGFGCHSELKITSAGISHCLHLILEVFNKVKKRFDEELILYSCVY